MIKPASCQLACLCVDSVDTSVDKKLNRLTQVIGLTTAPSHSAILPARIPLKVEAQNIKLLRLSINA
jgi:hypothetical protein